MCEDEPDLSVWGERWDPVLYGAFAGMNLLFGLIEVIVEHQYALGFDFAGIALVWGFFIYLRRRWMTNGWHRGRRAARLAAEEARLRGLSLGDWIVTEYERAL